jgi:hypothetical protein
LCIYGFCFIVAKNGAWNPHQVELALWTHYVASEMKPELLDTIPGPTENGTAHHEQKNGDTILKPQVKNIKSYADFMYILLTVVILKVPFFIYVYVVASHTAIPDRIDWCQPSILRNLCSF